MLTLRRSWDSISKESPRKMIFYSLKKPLAARTFASFNNTVQLDYHRYDPPPEVSEREGSLVILHGLLYVFPLDTTQLHA
jgi:hypothetical protein